MNFENLIISLERFSKILPSIVVDLQADDANWKPQDGSWSILEIVCHLADEETEDFRKRIRLTLEDPTQAWPPIDPEAVAVERKYNQQNLAEVLQRFLDERIRSIAWLRSLEDPEWDNTYLHPKIGELTAGEVMASWAAHDQLHLRQITKRLFQMNMRDAAPYTTDYGGEWKA